MHTNTELCITVIHTGDSKLGKKGMAETDQVSMDCEGLGGLGGTDFKFFKWVLRTPKSSHGWRSVVFQILKPDAQKREWRKQINISKNSSFRKITAKIC